MSRTHDLVNRHIAAFNAHDVDALLADFTPSADWITGEYTVPVGQGRCALGQNKDIELPMEGGASLKGR